MTLALPLTLENVKTVGQLNHYFDQLLDFDNDDLLFASSYLRGFINVASVAFGDEHQQLRTDLYEIVSQQVTAASDELNDVDKQIVNDFWLQLQSTFIKR
jgi:hypothetical protein